jgi:hypothetical protein
MRGHPAIHFRPNIPAEWRSDLLDLPSSKTNRTIYRRIGILRSGARQQGNREAE